MGLGAQLEEGVGAQQGPSAQQPEPTAGGGGPAPPSRGRSEVDVVNCLEGGAVVGGDGGGGVAWGGVGVGGEEGEGMREHSVGWGGCGRGEVEVSPPFACLPPLELPVSMAVVVGVAVGVVTRGVALFLKLAVWPNIDMVWEQRNGNGTRGILALEVASHLWC